MIGASCIGVVQVREGRLVDLPGVHYNHLVGDQGW